MKKIKFILPAMLAMILAGCNGNNKNANNNENGNQLAKNALMENIAVDTLSSAELLDTLEEISEVTDTTTEGNEETPTPDVPIEGETETPDENLTIVNKYIQLFETMTSEKGLVINLQESDREAYKYLLTINASLLGEEKQEFKLYYNEVIREINNEEMPDVDGEETGDTITDEKETTEETPEPTIKEKKHHHKFKFVELEGILIKDEQEIAVKGETFVDDEETKTSFKAELEDGKVVKIKSKISSEEKSYEYELKEKHRTIAKNKLKIEKDEEDGETKLKLEIKNSEENIKYEIKKIVKDEQEIYKIHYKNNAEKGYYIAYVSKDEEGNTVVTYETKDGGKHHHGDYGWGCGDHGHHHGHDFEWDWDQDDDFDYGELDKEFGQTPDEIDDILQKLLEELNIEDFDIDAFLEKYYSEKANEGCDSEFEFDEDDFEFDDDYEFEDEFDFEDDEFDFGGHQKEDYKEDHHRPNGHR